MLNRRTFGATVGGAIGTLMAPWSGRNARADKQENDQEEGPWTVLGYTSIQRHFYRSPDDKHGRRWLQECMENVGSVNSVWWRGKPDGTVRLASASLQIPKGKSVGCVECIFALVSAEEGATLRRLDFAGFFWHLSPAHQSSAEWIDAPDWALDIRGKSAKSSGGVLGR